MYSFRDHMVFCSVDIFHSKFLEYDANRIDTSGMEMKGQEKIKPNKNSW